MKDKTKVIELTKNNIEFFEKNGEILLKKIDKSSKYGFLVLYAPWCGHCQMFEPDIDFLSMELDGLVSFYKLNGDNDENSELLDKLDFTGYPTVFDLTLDSQDYYKIKDYGGNGRNVKDILEYITRE
tara:strand:- start:280 stop:660 length:381 start_codon:yes stop_codon:yes gene_type:complete